MKRKLVVCGVCDKWGVDLHVAVEYKRSLRAGKARKSQWTTTEDGVAYALCQTASVATLHKEQPQWPWHTRGGPRNLGGVIMGLSPGRWVVECIEIVKLWKWVSFSIELKGGKSLTHTPVLSMRSQCR